MFVLSPFIALESGEGSQRRRKWISWTTCCNFHCCFSSKLSAQVLLENGDTLIQLFLQCVHRGTLGMGRKESHTSHQCLIFIFILICYIFPFQLKNQVVFFSPDCQGPLQVLHYHLALGNLQRTPGADVSQDHLFHQNPIPRFVKREAFCFSASCLKWLNKLQPERDYQTYFSR